jgi:hypothetical protein
MVARQQALSGARHPVHRERHEPNVLTGPPRMPNSRALVAQAVEQRSVVACRSIRERPNGGGNQTEDAGAREHLFQYWTTSVPTGSPACEGLTKSLTAVASLPEWRRVATDNGSEVAQSDFRASLVAIGSIRTLLISNARLRTHLKMGRQAL